MPKSKSYSSSSRSNTGTKPKKPVKYATPALDKGLDVLELLARQPEGLTKTQLARQLDRTVSEIFRMLLCLERRGYIAQLDEDRYSLTLKLFKLVQEHPPTERLIVDALPVMNRLAHETLQSCHLGVLENSNVVIIAQTNAPTNLGFYVKLGSQVDIMEAASGYVILAHMDTAHRERTVAEWMRQTGRTPPKDFEAHLSRIRRVGYEKRPSYLVKGIANISFPIFDDKGSSVAALTIPHIQHSESNTNAADVTIALGNATMEISTAIGGRPPIG
jgi:DNA-binding IclR family transcriptional regulator